MPRQRLQAEAQRADRRRRRPVDHPEDVPPGRGGVRRRRGDPAGQRLPRPDAELPGQGRQVEPAARPRHAAQADGKYYLLPGLHEDVWPDYSLAVRTDILSSSTCSVPKTWDELHTVLKAMKAAYPDLYPLSDRWSTTARPGRQQPAAASSAGVRHPGRLGLPERHLGRRRRRSSSSPARWTQYKQMVEYLNKLVSREAARPGELHPAPTTRPGRSSPPASRS